MPHSNGYRAHTRYLFAVGAKNHGVEHMSSYLRTFKRGDYVDIKVNGRIHKGMPYRYYHGKTGVVWDITPRSIGVEVNKLVGNHISKKRIHVRIEHVQKSACHDDFLRRAKECREKVAEAKKSGLKVSLKRVPVGPEPAFVLDKSKLNIEDLKAIPYTEVF